MTATILGPLLQIFKDNGKQKEKEKKEGKKRRRSENKENHKVSLNLGYVIRFDLWVLIVTVNSRWTSL